MGVDDLWKCCVSGVKSKAPQHFKTSKNTRVAVDISCMLHTFIARPKNALSVCCVPPCPPTGVVTSLEVNHSMLKQNEIEPHYVFDGHRHPMKHETNLDHQNTKDKAKEVLK